MTTPFRFAIDRRTWLTPLLLILGLAGLFPAVYLAATVDPQTHLHGMRVALVVEPQGETGTQASPDYAATVARALQTAADTGTFELLVMDTAELDRRMGHDDVAGAIVVPATFNAAVQSLLPGSTRALTVPSIAIRTNAGDGGISNGLLTGNVAPLLAAAEEGLGRALTASVAQGGAATSSAQNHLLAAPFEVRTSAYEPLPESSGLGTSAFYYTLVLMLLGFVGASIVNPLVDSAVGFTPGEVGPLVTRRPYVPMSRRQTLAIKFAVMIAAAPLAALIVELVASYGAGIPIVAPGQLWALSTAAIAAVGVSALSVFALLGSGLGSLANTTFFIALSMTASGGTVPLSALPPFFEALAHVEPFRPVLQGVRAVFYFDAAPEAGLTTAWIHIGAGAAAGIALGLIVTTLYAKSPRFERRPQTV